MVFNISFPLEIRAITWKFNKLHKLVFTSRALQQNIVLWRVVVQGPSHLILSLLPQQSVNISCLLSILGPPNQAVLGYVCLCVCKVEMDTLVFSTSSSKFFIFQLISVGSFLPSLRTFQSSISVWIRKCELSRQWDGSVYPLSTIFCLVPAMHSIPFHPVVSFLPPLLLDYFWGLHLGFSCEFFCTADFVHTSGLPCVTNNSK